MLRANAFTLTTANTIRLSDMKGLPLIVSRAAEPYFAGSEELSALNVIATYNLVYNASLLVEDGLGYGNSYNTKHEVESLSPDIVC